jgi:hypothetical protein
MSHCAETREKAASPLIGSSQETCLQAVSTTLRMKERGKGSGEVFTPLRLKASDAFNPSRLRLSYFNA